ncbi:GntR family transcriptional regulator [Bosea sp. SSUT16]|jgi:GntR family transcriptional regulator of vanillate catabolism|uniref:GntR family transcriptional regulator n=1 Tax=Bosea spartocytisi TaxID=2773451 RepID=A0A927E512_9HYPH|nr:GntR family transcriptional regulator [Bosea spartocytisi]MBD3844479.1 GntR family transcriptional regulator [Bosea spartocytisi]MCT4470414.1 GntR family transcriptional regulator [Bosea spartocytisi]
MVTRTESVTRRLREAVLEGGYAPGGRLNEMALAETMQVSRTPIRAALSVLFAEGLLDYEPNCGYVVRRLSLDEAVNIYTVRATLEGLAARLAAENGLTASERERFQSTLDEMEQLVSGEAWGDGERQRWGDLNIAFHGLICSATGNSYLASSIQRTRTLPLLTEFGVSTFFAERAVVWWDRAAYRRSQDDHLDLGEAILSRQGARAEAVMREHIERAGRLIGRKLANRSDAALALS